MKKFLMVMLCFVIMFLIYRRSHAQIPIEKKLVADETWVISSGKTAFRIITSNDTIARKLMDRYNWIIMRYTSAQKKDRVGYYWERSFYFNNKHWNTLVAYINNRFR